MLSAAPDANALPRRLWRATAWLFAGRLATAGLGFLFFALLARQLAVAEFGRLTFHLALLALLEPLADFGTSAAVLQRGAGDGPALARAVTQGRRIRGTAVVLSALGLTLASRLVGESAPGWFLAAAALSLTRTLELSSVVFADRIEWRPPVWTRTSVATLRVLGALALARLGVTGFGPYLLLFAGAGALGHVVLHLVALGELRRLGPARDDRTASLLRAAAPLALAAVAQQAYVYADNLVLRALRTEVELGHYNAAMKVFSFAVLFAAFATQAALPWLVRRYRAGALRAATLRLATPLLVLGTLGVALLWPHGETLLRVAFGAPFEAAAPSLRWLLVAVLGVSLGAAPLTAVVAAGRSRATLAIALLGLVLNVALNLALVPERGIEGAAMATAATELAVATAAIATCLRTSPPPEVR